jgi:hypothetical protein
LEEIKFTIATRFWIIETEINQISLRERCHKWRREAAMRETKKREEDGSHFNSFSCFQFFSIKQILNFNLKMSKWSKIQMKQNSSRIIEYNWFESNSYNINLNISNIYIETR